MISTTTNPVTYKVVLVGDGSVGKTTFIMRHLTGDYIRTYVPTLGVEVHPLTFSTNYGPIRFNVWDTAGQEKFRGLGEGYYIQAEGCLAFFDVTSRPSFAHLGDWVDGVRGKVGEIPTILCGTKCDMEGDKVDLQKVKEHLPLPIYQISSKSNYNYDKPFLALARQLTGKDDLMFVEKPAINPPLIVLPQSSSL